MLTHYLHPRLPSPAHPRYPTSRKKLGAKSTLPHYLARIVFLSATSTLNVSDCCLFHTYLALQILLQSTRDFHGSYNRIDHRSDLSMNNNCVGLHYFFFCVNYISFWSFISSMSTERYKSVVFIQGNILHESVVFSKK